MNSLTQKVFPSTGNVVHDRKMARLHFLSPVLDLTRNAHVTSPVQKDHGRIRQLGKGSKRLAARVHLKVEWLLVPNAADHVKFAPDRTIVHGRVPVGLGTHGQMDVTDQVVVLHLEELVSSTSLDRKHKLLTTRLAHERGPGRVVKIAQSLEIPLDNVNKPAQPWKQSTRPVQTQSLKHLAVHETQT